MDPIAQLYEEILQYFLFLIKIGGVKVGIYAKFANFEKKWPKNHPIFTLKNKFEQNFS